MTKRNKFTAKQRAQAKRNALSDGQGARKKKSGASHRHLSGRHKRSFRDLSTRGEPTGAPR